VVLATSQNFTANARVGLADETLQRALSLARTGFPLRRRMAVERLPEFEELRDAGRAIKDHTLAHLDFYLELYEGNVTAAGGHVHWARTAEEARATVVEICRSVGARLVTKGKSMVAEEIALNDYLEASGITPVETDLGEYIIQLRHEPPSHIIAPAIHLMKEQVTDTFRAAHRGLAADRPLAEPRQLCDEAREVLRPRFLAADVGITGANFLVAETGSSIIVTNEGNGDLTQILPRVHIVLASLEKLVPTFEDAAALLRLLARSATGQEFSAYTTVSTGPRRPGDLDGPEQYHVILLDNGRSALLGGEFQDILRCIRCAACLNHCPVYAAVGGHAYGWVYPGPMGAVLTPSLIGVEAAGHLPNASTFCGRCESVCPVKIPLPKMMRHWREREFAQKLSPPAYRSGLALWAWVAGRPALYHALAELASRALGWAGRPHGRFRWLPFASGWTQVRDMPAPEGRSFHSLWAERQGSGAAR
jgi:L-lactate dehydrogenase complex protein LldF